MDLGDMFGVRAVLAALTVASRARTDRSFTRPPRVQEQARPATPPPTFASYTRPAELPAADWQELSIRLVGEHPLWGASAPTRPSVSVLLD
jgi:hypothetical protein